MSEEEDCAFAILLITLFFMFWAPRAEGVEQDKRLHFATSAFLAAGASTQTKESDHPIIYSTALAMIPGVLKEVYDAQHPLSHRAEGADIAADLAGALVGASVGHGIHIMQLGRRSVSVSIDF